MSQDPRALLRCMFDAAIEAAQPAHCVSPHLPPAPKGRLIVIGAGKASAEMARAVEEQWSGDLSGVVVTRYGYAVPCRRIEHVVPTHLSEVRTRRLEQVTKTEAAVKDRLGKEINYWDHRAEQLKAQEQAGKTNARLNSGEARKRADNLQARLQLRLRQLAEERELAALPPVVLGGLLVVPAGLLAKISGTAAPRTLTHPLDTQAPAAAARAAVMRIERQLGFEPVDREFERLGYDIESRVPGTGKLRFIEVKGRVSGAETLTVSRNEILYSLNKPDDFILAIVEFRPDEQPNVHYIRRPFDREPDFHVTSVNYSLAKLLNLAEPPA